MAKTTKLLSLKKLCLGLIVLVCNGVYSMEPASLSTNDTEVVMVKKAWETKETEMEMEMEMQMDSEINRRVLMMQKKYISYETLKKDVVPCDKPGASYYNCHNPRQANPYNRGCEVITGCARNTKS